MFAEVLPFGDRVDMEGGHHLCANRQSIPRSSSRLWACATANVADNTFQWLVRQCEDQMIVLSDPAFHAAEGDPTHVLV